MPKFLEVSDTAAARAALEATTVGSDVFTAEDADAARTALGATTVGSDVFTATDAADARTTLGATTVGSNVFTAADAAAARTTLGATTVGSNVFTATDAVAARSDLGAEATSVDTFNVQDYGAAGDGSTNDTTAIQAAIDAAETQVSAGGGRVVVYFPAGTYLVNGQLTVDAGIHLVGADNGGSAITRTTTNSTPVIHVDTPGFTMRNITMRCTAAVWYGSDSVAVYLENTVGAEWDNSVDAHFENCWISGFDTGISIFGQGLKVRNCDFTRLGNAVVLDFPDNDDLEDEGDDDQNFAQSGFRGFQFENIYTQAVTNFILNEGANAALLRACLVSNFVSDLGVTIWKGTMSGAIVTNFNVECSASAFQGNPVFWLDAGSHDSVISNGRYVGRQAYASPVIAERSIKNFIICDDVENLTIRDLHIENVREHGFDFTGYVHGLYMSDCHFKEVGYSGANWRQILFRDNDTQAFLNNLTFDINATTTTTPIILSEGSSDTLIIGENLRQIDEDHTALDIIATPTTAGTVIENGTSTAAPTVGNWKLGQVIWNKAASDVPLGWRCTARGVPGTWESIYKAPDTVWIPAASGYADTGATPVTPTKLASGEVPAIFMPGAGDTYLRAPVSIPEDWDTMWIDVFYTHEEASPSGSVRFNVGVVHLDLNAQIGSAITSQRSDTVDMAGVVANDFTIHTAGAAVDVDTTGGPVMVRAGRIGGSVFDTFTGDIAVIGVQLRKAT